MRRTVRQTSRLAVALAALLPFAALASSVADGIRTAQSCAAPLDPIDDGSGIPSDLVISEISPGSHIEIFNVGLTEIDLSAALFQLCSPFDYEAVADLVAPGTMLAPGAYRALPWPVNFTDLDSGGEVILYSDDDFGDSTHILDFTCWGQNPHSSRLGQAVSVGKWSGGCNDALATSALHRLPGTAGDTAADYDTATAPSPMTCSSELVFRDDFESGNLDGWSGTVP